MIPYPAGTNETQRRRLAVVTLLLSTALAGGVASALPANAATSRLPDAVRSLDAAAMALFDAAESANWTDAAKALESAKQASLRVGALEQTFLSANGSIARFIEVQNNLGADLIEAGLALSTRDQRWLISSADRIDSRAGELSRPFADPADDRLVPRVETLLFLARRMRRARVWSDEGGLRRASDDFKRLAASLNHELAGRSPEKERALAQALKALDHSASSADLKSLYATVDSLR